MAKKFRALAAAGGVMMAMTISATVWAQKQGGILRQYMIDSPASMSIHEEATPVATRPVESCSLHRGVRCELDFWELIPSIVDRME